MNSTKSNARTEVFPLLAPSVVREPSRKQHRRKQASKSKEQEADTREKPQLIWANESRNEFIAELADMIANELDFVLTADREDFIVPPWIHADVDILVENYEQGRRISALLPGWNFCFLRSEALGEDCDEVPEYDERRIVTFECFNRHGLQAGVVVRADGTGMR